MSPLLEPRTTLKDALSMLLGADVQAGIVVDGGGRVQGIVTLDAIVAELRAAAETGVPA
jgi:CBS domain-containing protein